ncbi:hypothetical protein [Halioglobus sp. HI00S01]|uniref:hypothetical protein n=1 Tax=Halioglobus sp. HI00S01 TaxID=1822214 RepID=UPI0012E7AF27|nr:hypothetical protein [Halioglobus sp. HI00S01]
MNLPASFLTRRADWIVAVALGSRIVITAGPHISEYFLLDNYGGKTVLGIVCKDGKSASFLEGTKAISADDQLKSAIQ